MAIYTISKIPAPARPESRCFAFVVDITARPEEVLDVSADPDPEVEAEVASVVLVKPPVEVIVAVMAGPVLLPVAAAPLPVAVDTAEGTKVAPGTALVPVPISKTSSSPGLKLVFAREISLFSRSYTT